MSTYKEIKGFKVQTLASDTAASVIDTGSWASGGNLNTARGELGGAGTSLTTLAFGGDADKDATEEWDVPATVTNTTITD